MVRFIYFLAVALLVSLFAGFSTSLPPAIRGAGVDSFSFASLGDAQAATAKFTITVNQAATLQPDLVIFNGDLENNGVAATEMGPMVTAIKNAGLYNKTFLVRGNHDNVIIDSAVLWENYFESPSNARNLPAGVIEYVALNSNSDYLIYSFIYGNAMFIGLDVPGNVDRLTSAQVTFLDARLTYAESQGLVHAFIFFHGPLYCVESLECPCSARRDASCTPSALVSVLNRHPIVSATFHGHDHVLSWTHMNNTRLPGLTGSFEQFITSPSGGATYSAYLYSARVDYAYMDLGTSQGFATVDVSGCAFSINMYKDGTTAPVWSRTFSKGICPTPTATIPSTPSHTPTETTTGTQTFTPSGTRTANYTPSLTFTVTPGGPTLTSSPTTTPTSTPTPTFTPPWNDHPQGIMFLPLIMIGP